MGGIQAELVGVGVMRKDVRRVRGKEVWRPTEEERWLCVPCRGTLELDAVHVHGGAVALVAHARLTEIPVQQVPAVCANAVEDRPLAQVHTLEKVSDGASTFASLAQALPARCQARHCSVKSRTPRSRSNKDMASEAVCTGTAASPAGVSRHAQAKALKAFGFACMARR